MDQRIVVAGSSNIDFVMKMARLPEPGETITDATFVQTFGGKGANQAVGAARAGGTVTFLNCVGDDPYAPIMLDQMTEAGVDVSNVRVEPGTISGTALVMIGGDGQNYLSVSPGANYALTPTVLEELQTLISDAAMVMLQCEIPWASNEWIISTAAAAGVPVMWNYAPARMAAPAYISDIDYLVVNETEAAHLTGLSVGTNEEVETAAATLRGLGCPNVIVTLGTHGSYLSCDKATTFVPAFVVDAIDATAAEDVYCGSLAVALVEGMPIDEAVRFASAASALSVTRLGAQPSAPTRRDINEFLIRGGQPQ